MPIVGRIILRPLLRPSVTFVRLCARAFLVMPAASLSRPSLEQSPEPPNFRLSVRVDSRFSPGYNLLLLYWSSDTASAACSLEAGISYKCRFFLGGILCTQL